MRLLQFLSEFTIPLVMFYIVGYGILQKKNVYESFISGAEEGLRIVVRILPTLVGLMVGVGVLRSSGFLDYIGDLLGGILSRFQLPGELVPLIVVRMFSSSAATGLCLDIFKEYGPDSRLGMITSIMMGCTETIFSYDERLLYDSEGKENQVYADWRSSGHLCRDRSQHCAGGVCVKDRKNPGKVFVKNRELALTAREKKNIMLFNNKIL